MLERLRRKRRDVSIEARGDKACARTRMFEDVADLRAVQLGVNEHSSEAGVPNPVQRFEIGDAILCNDRDAIAAVELAARAQRPGKPRRPHGECAIVEEDAFAQRGGRAAWMTFPGAF